MRSGPQLKEGMVMGIFDARIEVAPLQMADHFSERRFALHFRKKRSRLCLRTG